MREGNCYIEDSKYNRYFQGQDRVWVQYGKCMVSTTHKRVLSNQEVIKKYSRFPLPTGKFTPILLFCQNYLKLQPYPP